MIDVMQDCVSITTLMKASISNSILLSTKQADEDIIYWYEISIDLLMYVMMTTRSDIVFALSMTSQYCSNSNQTYIALIIWIFKYIKDTLKVSITFEESIELEVVKYSNADYNDAVDDKCSIEIWLFLLAEESIFWSVKRQITSAMSTCEAEYMILSEIKKKALWLRYIMMNLRLLSFKILTLIWADNKNAIALDENSKFHRKTKHIESKWHWIRSFIEREILLVKFISTASMTVDDLTKTLIPKTFRDFRSMMSM